MNNPNPTTVHWSFWVISLVGLLFNLMGCLNYISQTNGEVLNAMPEAYRNLVEARPAWATGAFAIAVFGGAVGAILLLVKKSAASLVFLVALIGALVTQVPLFGASGIPLGAWLGGLSQVLAVIFLIWYSRFANRKGWLG